MKQCPKCRQDYYDETLNFCLEDGMRLVGGIAGGESPTVVMHRPEQGLNGRTKKSPSFFQRKFLLISLFTVVFSVAGFFGFRYYSLTDRDVESTAVEKAKVSARLYWEKSEDEQYKFILERVPSVQRLIGDEPIELEQAEIRAIKIEVDAYLERKDSLSQQPFKEGLRTIYGRATQYAPLIIRTYNAQKVPPA